MVVSIVTMPLGILFASSPVFNLNIRQTYAMAGMIIAVPGLFYLLTSLFQSYKQVTARKDQEKENVKEHISE